MRVLEVLHILPSGAQQSAQERFLIVYLTKRLGDLVLMLPMIEALREEYSAARIEVAVHKAAASLFCAVPQVDKVWGFDLPRDFAGNGLEALGLGWRITTEYLRIMADEMSPTICIVPRWGDDGNRSGDLAYLTRASRRIGFDIRTLSDRLPFSEPTLTDAVSGGEGMHEPAKPLYLLQTVGLLQRQELESLSTRAIGSLQSFASTADWNALASRLGINPSERFAVVAPGATNLRRIWPLERWQAVGNMLQQNGLRVVVLSGPSDTEIALALHQLLSADGRGGSVAVAGITTIPESITLLAHCQIYLGPDSGPGHIAGALGVPTVIQFIGKHGAGPRDGYSPDRWRPVGPRLTCVVIPRTIEPCNLVCYADRQHCILTIETEQMLDATRHALAQAEVMA